MIKEENIQKLFSNIKNWKEQFFFNYIVFTKKIDIMKERAFLKLELFINREKNIDNGLLEIKVKLFVEDLLNENYLIAVEEYEVDINSKLGYKEEVTSKFFKDQNIKVLKKQIELTKNKINDFYKEYLE